MSPAIKPVEWEIIGTEIRLVIVNGHEGPRYAARRRDGCCLSKSGHFHIEPRPSSRSEAWLQKHRWPITDESVEEIVRLSTTGKDPRTP